MSVNSMEWLENISDEQFERVYPSEPVVNVLEKEVEPTSNQPMPTHELTKIEVGQVWQSTYTGISYIITRIEHNIMYCISQKTGNSFSFTERYIRDIARLVPPEQPKPASTPTKPVANWRPAIEFNDVTPGASDSLLTKTYNVRCQNGVISAGRLHIKSRRWDIDGIVGGPEMDFITHFAEMEVPEGPK